MVKILVIREQSHLVILFCDVIFSLSSAGNFRFLVRDSHGLYTEADTAPSRPVITQGLYRVKHLNNSGPVYFVVSVIQEFADFLFAELLIHEA